MNETEYYKRRHQLSQFMLNLTPMQIHWLHNVRHNLRDQPNIREICLNYFRDAAQLGIEKMVAYTLLHTATVTNGVRISPKALCALRDQAYTANVI